MDPILMYGIIFVLIYLSIMFAIVNIKQDMSIGNFTWGGMVMLITLYTFFTTSSYLPRQLLATMLIMLWGIRLAGYTYLRYKPGADPRFVSWRQQGGMKALIMRFGWIFILNGFMGLVMSTPIIAINTSTTPGLGWLDILGVIGWIVAFYWESVSDYQLYRFLHNPANKGKVMSSGLWRYSRHPNYFGEILNWWSIYLIALSVPYGYLTIVAPCAVSITLIFISGIPWLEKAMENNPEYQEYKKRTSMLIPWPPSRINS